MKIADVKIVFTKYGIQLCRMNKRGNPQAGGVDVTREVLDQLMDLLECADGKINSYDRLNGDSYEISCKKLTEEQKADRAEKKKYDSEKSAVEVGKLLAMFGTYCSTGRMFGSRTDMFEPVQPKIRDRSFFDCMKENCRHTRSFSTLANFSKYVGEQFDHGYNIALIEGAYRVASEMDYLERQKMSDWDWLEFFKDPFRITFN